MNIDIGIDEGARKKIADGLEGFLADTYSLYWLTHNFHWNVTGPMFQTLHLMFETQYNELWLALDGIAERIRSLGHAVPVSQSVLHERSQVNAPDAVPEAQEMIRLLTAANERVAKTARELYPVVQAGSDEVTADLLTQRLMVHEKTAWMLRSLLG